MPRWPPTSPPAPCPAAGRVTAGQASIGSSGANMAIDQGSQRAIINWQNFDIGSQASVTFRQPDASAVALNRVSGPTASRIEGQLTANGQVFLINPSGVLFGKRGARPCRRAGRLHPEHPRRRLPVRQFRLQRQWRQHRQRGADHGRARRLPGLHFPGHRQQRRRQRAAGNGRHGSRRTCPPQLRRRPAGWPRRQRRRHRHADRESSGDPRRGWRHPAHRRRRRSGHARRHQQQRRARGVQPDVRRRAHRAHRRQRHHPRRRLDGCGRRQKRRRNHRPGADRHAPRRRQPRGARRRRQGRRHPVARPPGRPRQRRTGRRLGGDRRRHGAGRRRLSGRQCRRAKRLPHLCRSAVDDHGRRAAAGRRRQGHRLGRRCNALLRQHLGARRQPVRQRRLCRDLGQGIPGSQWLGGCQRACRTSRPMVARPAQHHDQHRRSHERWNGAPKFRCHGRQCCGRSRRHPDFPEHRDQRHDHDGLDRHSGWQHHGGLSHRQDGGRQRHADAQCGQQHRVQFRRQRRLDGRPARFHAQCGRRDQQLARRQPQRRHAHAQCRRRRDPVLAHYRQYHGREERRRDIHPVAEQYLYRRDDGQRRHAGPRREQCTGQWIEPRGQRRHVQHCQPKRYGCRRPTVVRCDYRHDRNADLDQRV
jgi:filamentous hemagglutinin family protein